MTKTIKAYFTFAVMVSLAAAVSQSAATEESDGPCSLTSFDEVADWTGVKVQHTLPQGNLKVLASCTFGGVERPPVLSYVVTRGAAARESFESNRMWPDITSVTGIGEEATWIPSRRMLAVLSRSDLYLLVRIDDQSVKNPSEHLALAQQIATVLLGRLDG